MSGYILSIIGIIVAGVFLDIVLPFGVLNKYIKALNWCDVLLFVFDGRVPDEGACFELGFAYAKRKRCVALKTDPRSLIGGVDNLMLTVPMEATFCNIDELKMFFGRKQHC